MSTHNHLSAKEYYEYYSSHIEKEIDLVNNRLSWMLTFQGFLFASISIATSNESEAATRLFLRNALSLAGIAVAILTLLGVFASALQRDTLKNHWKNHKINDFPPLGGNRLVSAMGRITSFGIPVTIIATWAAIWRGIS